MSTERLQGLAERLAGSEVPGAQAARARGISTVASRVAHTPPRRAVPRIIALPLVLALMVAAALTPPGRAAADWVAELVGIGEVGGPPSVDEPVSGAPPASDRMVIATGESPSGEPFELVLYRSDQLPHTSGDRRPTGTCVQTVFPEAAERFDGGGSGTCHYGGARGHAVRALGLGFPGPKYGGPIAQGEATPEARRVELSYDGPSGKRRRVEATVARVTGETASSVGIERPAAYFVAFLPGFERPETGLLPDIDLIAYGRRGEVVARDNTADRP